MTDDVKWCAYHAVQHGILTPELCLQIKQMFDGSCSLQMFAQTILDNGLSSDIEFVQKIMNDAHTRAANGEAPPTDYFADNATSESAPPPAAAVKSTAEAKPAPAAKPTPAATAKTPSKPAASGSSPNEEKLWEKLAQVEQMTDDEARAWMSDCLLLMRAKGASDFHLSALSEPFARINLMVVKFGATSLTPEAALKLNTCLLSPADKEDFIKRGDFDICLELNDSNRYRVCLMMFKNGAAGTYRIVPNKITTLQDLGFTNTQAIYKLLDYHNGLILVTGSVGSGKTTTLASLIDYINEKRHDHIITVESPVEIVQTAKNCNVTQREVGRHTKSYASALKGALREDPDIIVIGELRDLETIEMAIKASETGHLVIGTLQTSDAGSTLNLLLDVFPPDQQQQIRSMVAESLRGIICQQLIPSTDDKLIVALEILINNIAVGNNIRENKTHQLKQIIETGLKVGMCTIDQSIFALYEDGRVSESTALSLITEKNYLNRIKNKQLAQSAAAAEPAAAAQETKKKGFFR